MLKKIGLFWLKKTLDLTKILPWQATQKHNKVVVFIYTNKKFENQVTKMVGW